MEFEDVSEWVEWEARRIAAAFGVKAWTQELYYGNFVSLANFKGYAGDYVVEWDIELAEMRLDNVQIGRWEGPYDCCSIVSAGSNDWTCEPNPKYNDLMVCGLYRLGFEDDFILSQLPALSAHEKLELRLSLPREFWPQKWLDEDANT